MSDSATKKHTKQLKGSGYLDTLDFAGLDIV